MTKWHHDIFNLLFPVCLETTKKMREKYPPIGAGDSIEDKKLKKLQKLTKYLNSSEVAGNIGKEYQKFIITAIAFALDEPYLLKAANKITNPQAQKDTYDPLSIVFIEEIANNTYGFNVNTPYILLHSNGKVLAHYNNTVVTNYTIIEGTLNTSFRAATDEEVETCLESLIPPQLRFITQSDIFAAALSPLFEEQDELVVDEKENKEDGK